MRLRPLGASQIDASVIGFGAWAIGGWMWGGANEADAIRAIHAALDAGSISSTRRRSTASASPRRLSARRSRAAATAPLIATKCGMVTNTKLGAAKFRSTGLGSSPNGHIDVRIFNHPDSIREEVEFSLQAFADRSHRSLPDALAGPHDADRRDDGRALVAQAGRQDSRDRRVQRHGRPDAQYASRGQLDSDQESYSMIDRKLEAEQLPYLPRTSRRSARLFADRRWACSPARWARSGSSATATSAASSHGLPGESRQGGRPCSAN